MLNYSQEELCHMTFLDITAPGDLEESRANVQALWHGDIPSFQMEKKYLRKDGAVIDGSLSATLVYDVGRQPLFAVAMVNDITERVKIEKELANTKVLSAVGLRANSPFRWRWSVHPAASSGSINPACFESLGAEAEPSPVGHSMRHIQPNKVAGL